MSPFRLLMPTRPDIHTFALNLPVFHGFDYEVADHAQCRPGQRYVLPFGARHRVGISLTQSSGDSIDPSRLKAVQRQLDDEPLLSTHIIELAQWIADYYCQPLGEVLFQCLPRYCRHPRAVQPTWIDVWVAAEADDTIIEAMQNKAPRQHQLLLALRASCDGLNADQLRQVHHDWSQPIKALAAKGLVRRNRRESLPSTSTDVQPAPELTAAQAKLVDQLTRRLHGFQTHVLQGVTGSGKTEIYLRLMQRIIAQHRQVIYLVPEIGLTPQLLQRLRARLGAGVVSSHSALSEHQRYRSWDQFKRGVASVLVGTRSALFSDAPGLGLIIIDEEHDASFRQQDGVRYHARDVAIKRAQMIDIPIVLGSATPSLETLHNCAKAHYRLHHLGRRPDQAPAPQLSLIDCRNSPLLSGCSPPLLQAIERHLQAQGQVLLFLNRRGYAPVVMCYQCGWQATCHQCDARLTLHQSINRLICHHCGYRSAVAEVCPDCGDDRVRHYGVGTQQLESFLQSRFNHTDVIRIDRDSVSRSVGLEQRLQPVREGRPCILVGTQMLAKGHDYPGISLVGIIDADQALFSSYFRASERLVQTVLQVAGRAGRAQRPGQALIQTAFADHPLMRSLCQQGYSELVRPILEERRLLGFPPSTSAVALMADAVELERAIDALQGIRNTISALKPEQGIRLVGPIPALMPRRFGRHRAQLALISPSRSSLRNLMRQLMPRIASRLNSQHAHIVIEVDPLDL